MPGYEKSIPFQIELPADHMGDNSWVRDDGGPMGNDWRNYYDGTVLVVKGMVRDGMVEIPLMRLNEDNDIIETLLVCFRHERHEPPPKEATADAAQG